MSHGSSLQPSKHHLYVKRRLRNTGTHGYQPRTWWILSFFTSKLVLRRGGPRIWLIDWGVCLQEVWCQRNMAWAKLNGGSMIEDVTNSEGELELMWVYVLGMECLSSSLSSENASSGMMVDFCLIGGPTPCDGQLGFPHRSRTPPDLSVWTGHNFNLHLTICNCW